MSITFSAQNTAGESARWEPGTTEFQLQSIEITETSNFEKTEKFPAARFVWADADNDVFYDSFVKIPLGFRLNDKAKFTNRLSALVGRPLKDEDAVRLRIDLGDDILSYDDLAAAVRGGTRQVVVHALEFAEDGVNFESLLGRKALLKLGVNDKGYNTCAAGDASPVPRAGGTKKRNAANPFE